MDEYDFETPEPVELHAELGSGSLQITAGQVGVTKVAVDGDEGGDVTVTQEGRQISIRSRSGRRLFGVGISAELDVRVLVPTGSDLVVRCGSAGTSADGTYGTGSLRAGSGGIRVEAFAGDATVTTGSGDIELGAVGGSLRSKTGSGSLAVGRCDGEAVVTSGSGSLRFDTFGRLLAAKTGSGDLEVGRAGERLEFSAGSGDLRVRELRAGQVQAKTGSGDIDLAIPAGTPVWTDLRTVSGRVDNQLPSVGQPAEGDPFVHLRVVTASGDVRLRPA